MALLLQLAAAWPGLHWVSAVLLQPGFFAIVPAAALLLLVVSLLGPVLPALRSAAAAWHGVPDALLIAA